MLCVKLDGCNDIMPSLSSGHQDLQDLQELPEVPGVPGDLDGQEGYMYLSILSRLRNSALHTERDLKSLAQISEWNI